MHPASERISTTALPASEIRAAEERVSRGIVAAHRARLDWLLHVPEWTELYEQALVVLGLPGRRQGIRLDAALDALALEHKHQLVRWAAEHFTHHLSRAVAQTLCRVVGVERFSEVDLDSTLTLRQWARLREAMLFRLAREHQRYKHAQQLLFVSYGHVVDRVVDQVVFAPVHRADCAQEGALGLLQAIDRVATEGDFSAYCGAWVRRAVRNYLVRQRLPVHAPVNLIVRATTQRTEAEAGVGDAGGAGHEESGRLEAVLLEMLRHPAVALDQEPLAGEAPIRETIEDTAAECPAQIADRADLRACVARGLRGLTEKQRDVLLRRFGLEGAAPQTLAEVARRVGISHQQVSMRERRALQRLETTLASVVAEYDGRW